MSGFLGRAAAMALCAALGLLVTTQAIAETRTKLTGAGATFPAALYYKWLELYAKEHPELSIAYDAVGSGDGVARFIAGSVDFAASDAGIAPDEAGRVGRGVLVVPATAGLVVLAYNLSGLGGPLQLPRDIYADILSGAIKRWDDPRIKQANPGLKLPQRTIAVVARLDKSGTTFALTNHLSAISETWKKSPGVGTAIEWPSGTMLARGNEGVASRIKISEGSIGYVEYGFAKRLNLAMAELQNKAGNFVAPAEASGQSALAEGAAVSGESGPVFITDPANAGSYPVVTYSWLLLYKQYPDAQKRAALQDFIGWGLRNGQEIGRPLGYIPLPPSVAAQAQGALRAIE